MTMKHANPLYRLLFTLALCFCFASPVMADEVQAKLDDFARNHIKTMNSCILPSAAKKEVVQNQDGSFTARYTEFDPQSLSSSYHSPQSGTKEFTYIGFMRYCEVEYQCTAPTADLALNGPFIVSRRKTLSEPVPFRQGKWSLPK